MKKAFILAACLASGGCMVGPRYQQPTVATPAVPNYKESPINFKDADGWKVAQPGDAMLRGNWWEIFHEPELNDFEKQLNINNQNIKLYFENYMAARAQIREAHSQLYPTVGTAPNISATGSGGGGGRNGVSTITTTGGAVGSTIGAGTVGTGNVGSGGSVGTGSTSGGTGAGGTTVGTGGTGSSSGNGGTAGTTTVGTVTGTHASTSSQFTLPIDISWAPDLFGRIRNTVREYQFAAQVSAADLENERLLEQATLAQLYFELRGQDALQQVLDETVKADQAVVDITQGLYDTGIDSQVSLEQAKQIVESAQATATNAGIARAQYEHAIATLLGKAASTFSIPVRALTAAPPAIPTGTPSELLERRPDIAAAERQMAEANAIIGIGRAAYYPNITLSASGGFTGTSLLNWFTWPSRFFSIGPSLSETIFDAGLRRATVDQYIATYNGDLANYRQIVLTAFQQVEDYLAETRILSIQIQQANAANESAERAFQLEQYRFQTGLDPYVNLLTTQTALLNTRQSLVTAKVQQMSSAVLLIEALGGGWDRSDLPTVQQVSQKPPEADRQIQH